MRTIGAKEAWEQVCLPKKERGLGIKRITEWNKIALLKHIWNPCNDSDGSIWSTWIRSNLLRGRNFWTIKALDPKAQIISTAKDAVHHRRWHDNLSMV